MFTLDLSANVPLYGQQVCDWCGAASGEMTRNGYPNPADRVFYQQSDVWNTIQIYNSTNPADSGWATDPHGLTGALMNLANPSGVDWVEYSNASRDAVLHFMLYWMSVRKYPTPVLVNQGGHWVVITGYECDVQPAPGNTVSLQQITYLDPEPHNIGTHTTMSASQWYNAPWNGAIIYSGTWLNTYVAIVEPPKATGSVKIDMVGRTGTRLLSPQEATEHARRWIKELGLSEKPRYAILARSDVVPLEPMVVLDHPRADRKEEKPPQYYIVPFGIHSESERGKQLTRVSVLLNGYSGAFEEATAFGKPVHYLTRDEALTMAATALHISRNALGDVKATLVFQPSRASHIRAFPYWEIVYKDRTFYMDQIGEIFTKLLSIPGD
ncbi:MAG TPA: hypothetical protein VMG39_13055 [Pseudolabrys sp.]|nr:hypothetical protein [Pseudolabrys sp.]